MKTRPPWSPQQQTLLNKTTDFYHQALLKNPEALRLIGDMGLSEPALLATFRVGFVDGTIRDALPLEGELVDDLKHVGILERHCKERFAGCVAFPIVDAPGNVVQICGRDVTGEAEDLYLHRNGLGVWNRVCFRAATRVLLCQSPVEAAMLWNAGFRNTTACQGRLTEEHLTLFREHQTEAVYVVGFAKNAGKNIGKALADEGLEVFDVRLPPGEGLGRFLQAHTMDGFNTLLRAAEAAGPKTARAAGQPVPCQTKAHEDSEQVENLPGGVRFTYVPAGIGLPRVYVVRLLDRDPAKLRATVKALTDNRNRFHLDTVDLLSARSRKAFAADASELCGTAPDTLLSDMNRIVAHFEEETVRPQSGEDKGSQGLTEADRREAELLGRRPDLMEVIARDMERSGYIGERHNALVAYLAMTSRKMEDPLALMIVSGSGAGKSALQEAALAFCPPEDMVKVTSMTGRALFYRAETSLCHKVLAFEESAGAQEAAYALRSLISSKALVIESTVRDPASGRLTTMQNRVCGPTAVFQTTTRPDGDPETRSRFLVTTLDESRSQTARILEAQRRARTLEGFTNRLQRPEILSRHHAFQRLLKPIPVFNPFAGRLSFSADRLLMRRDQPKYLAMIETIAFLHQMQRPLKRMTQDERLVPGDRQAEYVEVELSDIAMANELAADILGQSLDDLSGPSRRLLLLIEEMVAARARQQGEEPSAVLFTRRQVREFSRWSDYQVKTYICQLADLEYLVPVCGRFGRQYRYRLAWDGKGRSAEAAQLGIKSAEQLRLELYPEDLEGGKANLAATWRS